MASPRILSVGKNPTLISSRTLILRSTGYTVDEAYSVDKARTLVESDLIDLTLICHTVSRNDQQTIISFIREKRQLMPILFIRSYAFESAPRTCIAVNNDPEDLLNTVRLATEIR
jgi:CheY-like chemotaxis protein